MSYKLPILFLLLTSTAHAKIITLGNPKNIKGFEEHLNKNPDKKSLINTVIQNEIHSSNKIIKDKFDLAVKGLTMPDLKPSIYLFKELADYKNRKIISESSRKYIAEAYYRLSNLERLKTDFWIREGLSFNPKYFPPKDIFNPEIISIHQKNLNNFTNYSIKVNKESVTKSHLFINGLLRRSDFKIHPSMSYNVKVFQYGKYPFEKKLTGEEMSLLKEVNLQSLNLGTCKKPKFTTFKNIEIDEIYFSKNCIKVKNPRTQNKDLLYTKSSPKYLKMEPQSKTKKKKEKNLFQKKSTWYVIAGAVITSAIIISLNQNKDVRVEPVHR